ncbi:MAG: GNAT family N-acetyltransferase [Caldimonas sp.]
MSAGCEPISGRFSADLLSRVEDAGLNASAPREQRWVDGWLVRFSPAKAKRARCIQPVAAGRLTVAEKLALCLPIYETAGLRPYVRITPFSQPGDLDARLAAAGMVSIDETRVMVLASIASLAAAPSTGPSLRVAAVGPADFADWAGKERGSSAEERRAHADRIAYSPVPHRSVLAFAEDGSTVGAGQVVVEGDLAGLYGVLTAEGHRRQGVAEAVCRHLLDLATIAGARIAYLQVEASNEPARRIYRRLGFVDGYAYHYRTPPQP